MKYHTVTLAVPVYPDMNQPANWDWNDLLDCVPTVIVTDPGQWLNYSEAHSMLCDYWSADDAASMLTGYDESETDDE